MHKKSDKPTQSDVAFSLGLIIIVLSLQKCSFKIFPIQREHLGQCKRHTIE